jgi:hypothetical protein
MSVAQVMRTPVGTLITDHVTARTLIDSFGNTVVDLGEDGKTVVRADVRVDIVAPSVTLPSATFTESGGAALAGDLSVAGHSTLATVDAESVSATSVSTPLLTAPADGILEIVAETVNVGGDLVIDGTLGTPDASGLAVRNASIVLGAGDLVSDVSRDSAGLVVPGKPENLPEGMDAADYEHSIRWKRNEGDYATAGDPMAPHQRPRWTFSGGCVSIAGSDASEWFIAPHTDTTTGEASLGIYYHSAVADPILIQRFVSVAP